jgi:hypothetical protein
MTEPFDERDPFDALLHQRLDRLTAAIPVDPYPGASQTRRRAAHRRRSLRIGLLAAGMVLLFALGTVAGSLIMGRPSDSSGAFARGGLLHCSGIDQLPPSAAATWLAARGLVAHWQVEDRTAQTSEPQEEPPDRGAIIDALELADGHLMILVQRDRDEPFPPRPCP